MDFGNILFSLWFFLPVGLANCTPIFMAHVPFFKKWSYPLDCYITVNGKRLLGNHKTIRGITSGILVAIGVVYLQRYMYIHYSFMQHISIDYKTVNPLLLGTLAGGGALGGDAIKSFFKRQFAVLPGNTWFPLDQLDYIIGASITTWFLVPLSFTMYLTIAIVWFFLHLVTSFLGYVLNLKEKPI